MRLRLASTDGISRGAKIVDTGAPISVPVGEETLGRIFNLLGEPVDKKGPVKAKERRSIHQEPPQFDQLQPKSEILKPVSRLSTCLLLISRVEKPVCSVVPVLVRPLLSWNLSTTLPSSMADIQYSPVLVREQGKEMTSGSK